MIVEGLFTYVVSFLTFLGGTAAVTVALVTFFGSVWAEKIGQKAKASLDSELESHRVRLRKSEFIFEKQYSAAVEFQSFYRKFSPEKTSSDLDWTDALEQIAYNFRFTEKDIDSFLKLYSLAVSDEVEKLLQTAQNLCGSEKFDVEETLVHTESIGDSSIEKAEKLNGILKDVSRKLRENLYSQVGIKE